MTGSLKIVGINLDPHQATILLDVLDDVRSSFPLKAEAETYYIVNDYDYSERFADVSLVISHYPLSLFPLSPKLIIKRNFHWTATLREIEQLKSKRPVSLDI